MTAKEYLQEIKKMDIKLNQRQWEYDKMLHSRTYIRGMDYAEERVQTSPNGSTFTCLSDKLTDIAAEINTEIDRFCDIKHKRINQIQELSRSEYIDILFKRYFEYKDFDTIAGEMGYTYGSVLHIHGNALAEFQRIFIES